MERYIAFDVETPNKENTRMSAIGITVIEDGRIVDSFFSYVNPEQPFDSFNVELTKERWLMLLFSRNCGNRFSR